MTDQLFDLLKELSRSFVKYVVGGGVACVLQGVERSTYDLDLILSMDEDNLKKLIDISNKFGLKPRIPEPVENLFDETKKNKWINEKGEIVYTLSSQTGPLQIDILLNYPKPFEELYNDANIIEIENVKIPFCSKEEISER